MTTVEIIEQHNTVEITNETNTVVVNQSNTTVEISTVGAQGIQGPQGEAGSANGDATPYGASWDGSTAVPIQNAIYDKIESLFAGLVTGQIVFPSSGTLAGSSNIFWDNSTNELRLGGATTQNAKLVLRTEASDLYGIYLDSSTTPFNVASGQHVGQRLVINGATSSSGYPVSITGQNLTLTNTANVTLIDDEEGWVNYGFQGNAAASGNVSYSPISSNGEYNKAFYFTFNRSGNVTNTEHSVVQDAMDIASINTQIFNNAGGTFYQYLSGLRLVSTGTGNCTAGALTRENKGIDITVFNFGSGNITSTAYGLFLNPNSSLVGTSWGIYDAWGANHWLKGKVYSGSTEATPTARLHLAAHSTAAASAPIKLTSGTAMTTPENGALEYHSSHLYFTIGSTRYQLDQQQPLDSTLTALAAYNTNGLLTQTAADTFTGRTITGTANQVTVTNGDGVSGNPTLSLPQNIHTTATPTFATLTLNDDPYASGWNGSTLVPTKNAVYDALELIRPGTIALMTASGTVTYYRPSADTNAARGTALVSAVSAMASGDSLVIGQGTYLINSTLTPPANSSISGVGMPIILTNAFTDGTCAITLSNSNVTIENLKVQSNTTCLGLHSATPTTIQNLILRNVEATVTDTDANALMFSQIHGGGNTEHLVTANIYNCKLWGGTIAGFGSHASLQTGSLMNYYDCDIYGATDGYLHKNSAGTSTGVTNIYGGRAVSVLDAITSGGSGNVVNVYGGYAYGDQADLYGDDGTLNVYWTAFRSGSAVGNGLVYNNHPVVGNLIPNENDTGSLGVLGTGWSDLFLASGAVINWASSDITLTHSANVLTLDGGGIVFNEAGGDFDYRFETDTRTHALFIDGGTNTININNSNTSLMPGFLNFGQDLGLKIALYPTTGTNGYGIGIQASQIQILNEGVRTTFNTGASASATIHAQISNSAGVNTIFNNQLLNIDFIVKGDTNADLLFVDASVDMVGVRTAAPQQPFHVTGRIQQQSATGAATTKGLLMTGFALNEGGSNDANAGVVFTMTYNATGNRQLALFDSDDVGDNVDTGFRYILGYDIPMIDGISGTGATRRNINLGFTDNNVGFGFDVTTAAQADIAAKVHIRGTTEQLRVAYNASNYYSTTVGSTGIVTFNAVGSGSSFVFSDNVTARMVPRVTSVASSATPTPNADTDELYDLTALAAGATFAAPTGTALNGQNLTIRIKDNGTARTLAWNAAYVPCGVALPTTTILGKILVLGFKYNTANALNKWQLVASAQEA